jgi:hypothetical protein
MLGTSFPSVRAAAVVAAAMMLSTPTCTRSRIFHESDLGSMVARRNEAPLGLVYSSAPELSGPITLESLRSDAEGREALQNAGFRAAHVATMAAPDLLDFLVLRPTERSLPRHAMLVTAEALLFGSEDGARRALVFLRRDAAARMASERALPAEEFGDGAFALEGTDSEGRPTMVYGWSEENTCQVVRSVGAVNPSDVLFIARNMHRRAEGSI